MRTRNSPFCWSGTTPSLTTPYVVVVVVSPMRSLTSYEKEPPEPGCTLPNSRTVRAGKLPVRASGPVTEKVPRLSNTYAAVTGGFAMVLGASIRGAARGSGVGQPVGEGSGAGGLGCATDTGTVYGGGGSVTTLGGGGSGT